jgi:hypothetical protein
VTLWLWHDAGASAPWQLVTGTSAIVLWSMCEAAFEPDVGAKIACFQQAIEPFGSCLRDTEWRYVVAMKVCDVAEGISAR